MKLSFFYVKENLFSYVISQSKYSSLNQHSRSVDEATG